MRAKPSSYELALLASMVVLLAWSGIRAARPVHLVARDRADLHRRAGADLALPDAPSDPAHLHARSGSTASSSCSAATTPTPRCRSASGWRAGSASAGTITTGSGTWPRGSFRRCWRARSSSAARRWPGADGCRSSSVCFCLAFSAFYELIEFWTALSAGGAAATDFLGTQGDVWDTQWDMQLALIGAIVSLVMLSRVQDRQLARGVPNRSA